MFSARILRGSRPAGTVAGAAPALVVLVASLALAGCSSSGGSSTTTAGSTPAVVASSTPAHPSSVAPHASSASPTVSAAQVRSRAAAAVSAIEGKQPKGAISVAAENLSTGAAFRAGATSGMWTASAYKLFVLETLLLQRQGDGGLSGYEQGRAVPMIEQSDNVAAYSLFLAAGGRPALVSAAQRFGMHHTVPGYSDPTFTRTSASDYLQLLRNLTSSHSPLTSASRQYALHLMRNVEADQRWGVGVVSDRGTTFANKNGWLSIDNNGPGESDDGLWAVTSVGVLTVHGKPVIMAVFTRHQPSMGAGVALIQKLARAIAPAVS